MERNKTKLSNCGKTLTPVKKRRILDTFFNWTIYKHKKTYNSKFDKFMQQNTIFSSLKIYSKWSLLAARQGGMCWLRRPH